MTVHGSDKPKAWHHAVRPIFGVIVAQGTASALGLVTGLWVVRSLSTGQYALYTIATSVLGSMVLLADAGISAGTLAQGGRVWRDRAALGMVVNTALGLRRRFAWAVAVVALPVLAVLLMKSGASGTATILWLGAVAFVFAAGLKQLIWEIPLRLHEALRITQRTAVAQALLRTLLIFAALAAWPLGLPALIATGLAQAWASWRLAREGGKLVASGKELVASNSELVASSKGLVTSDQRLESSSSEFEGQGTEQAASSQKPGASSQQLGTSSSDRSAIEASILAVVRRSLPSALYFVLTQQFALWFLSLSGTALAVAQYGALSRIAVVLGVLTSVNHAIFAPRFARLAEARALPRTYVRLLGIILLLCLPFNLLAWVAPGALISLVGQAYAGLTFELRLAVFIATIQAVGGAGFHLGYARGWLLPPLATITSAMAVQAGCVLWLDLSSLRGALGMGLALALHQMIGSLGYCAYRMRSQKLRAVGGLKPET